ncbi:small s protein-like protein [Corynascus novoguineensis]|uniref:Small s protein-like protein n=1 Tax=Corynascus novoguineensis TaxID=1126955 RepID=A0AAN7CTY2_9PEZI|nr:small s protein-like protein [Corynascus novoguineensis]
MEPAGAAMDLDALSVAARFSVESESLQIKIKGERGRLMDWADSGGLTALNLGSYLDLSKVKATKNDPAVGNNVLQQPTQRTAVAGLLRSFAQILNDVEGLEKRYGLARQTETYASFHSRQVVATQEQAALFPGARFVVVDESKFLALIGDLKAIIDALYALLPLINNNARDKMSANTTHSNDARHLKKPLSGVVDMTDLISKTASLQLEMPSDTSPHPPKPLSVSYNDAGALLIHKGYSTPHSLSCFARLSGTWEGKPDELEEVEPTFHPAFATRFISEPILKVAESLLEVDVAADPKYAGWAPGSTSLTGFAREITYWSICRLAKCGGLPSIKVWWRVTDRPTINGNLILERWKSLVREGLGKDWTERKGHDEVRDLCGPSEYTWLDPEEGFKLRHQIADLLADMNTSAVPDLQTVGCVNSLFSRSHNNEYNAFDVCLLLIQARAWHGVLTPRNILSMVAAELWTKTEICGSGANTSFNATKHTIDEQMEGIVKFAEKMSWPYLDEIRKGADRWHNLGLDTTEEIPVQACDWRWGTVLPGSYFAITTLCTLQELSDTLRQRRSYPDFELTEGRYGVVYSQASYWSVRSVIGKVLAPMSSLSSSKAPDGNGNGIQCLSGWVGPCPCPSPPFPQFDLALYAELDARPPSFDAAGWSVFDPDDLDTGDGDQSASVSTTESRRGVTGDAAEWIEPVPPPRSTDTARLQALRLSKVTNISETIERDHATSTGKVKPLQCRARLDFFLTRSKTTVWLRLYVNSIFVAAPRCRGGSGGAAHRFDPCKAAAYTFRTLSIEDLPQAELEGMEGPGSDGGSGGSAAVTVINATGGVEAEAFARAWCCQKGVNAVVWERDRGRCCFKCALTVAGPEGLGLKVLIMIWGRIGKRGVSIP